MADLIMTIPYYPGNVGEAYNRIMRKLDGWVGFADHDIQFVNPDWYNIFSRAIDALGVEAGFITCVTNRIGCGQQKASADRKSDDIKYHRDRAQEIYAKEGEKYIEVRQPSALVFVTHKKAWETVGGFRNNGILGVDTNYAGKITEAGYKAYKIAGLYVYHWYRGAR